MASLTYLVQGFHDVHGIPIFGFAILASVVVGPPLGVWLALRRSLRARDTARSELPAALAAPIDRLYHVVPEIAEARHRRSLRAVVERVVLLRRALGAAPDPSLDEELGRAVDLSLVAASRLDELDRDLARADLREPSAEVRARLHERDRWSTRLLDLAADLEMLHCRVVHARAALGSSGAAQLLDDLRADVDALEELQSQ
jgi:hypothetical protein